LPHQRVQPFLTSLTFPPFGRTTRRHSNVVPVTNNVDRVMLLCYLPSCWIAPPSRPQQRSLSSAPPHLPLLQHSTRMPSFVFNRLRTLLNSQFRLICSMRCTLFAKNTRGGTQALSNPRLCVPRAKPNGILLFRKMSM